MLRRLVRLTPAGAPPCTPPAELEPLLPLELEPAVPGAALSVPPVLLFVLLKSDVRLLRRVDPL